MRLVGFVGGVGGGVGAASVMWALIGFSPHEKLLIYDQ